MLHFFQYFYFFDRTVCVDVSEQSNLGGNHVLESPGKAAARRFFYSEFLPSVFSEVELRSAGVLTMLGRDGLELPYLDRLGVSRGNIFSVERDPVVMRTQLDRRWGVSLYQGDLTRFLVQQLHANRRLAILNLDVEGSYRRNIDAAMAPILLFCLLYPRTVVATYATIGRDEETLWEGVLSLALLMYLAPRETDALVAYLCGIYRKAGYETPMSMTLRDLFWIRSVYENSILAAQAIGVTAPVALSVYYQLLSELWTEICARPTITLTFGDLASRIEFLRAASHISTPSLPHLSVQVASLRHVIYRGNASLSQRCYPVFFDSVNVFAATEEWFRRSLKIFLDSPFCYFDRHGTRHDFLPPTDHVEPPNCLTVWRDGRLYQFRPRRLKGAFLTPSIRRTLQAIYRQIRSGQDEVMDTEPISTPVCIDIQGYETTEGCLTVEGKEALARLAREGRSTQEIIESLRLTLTPPTRVRAHVAVARRRRVVAVEPSPAPDFVRPSHNPGYVADGELTVMGRQELAQLARENRELSTADVMHMLEIEPQAIAPRRITAYIAVARRSRSTN